MKYAVTFGFLLLASPVLPQCTAGQDIDYGRDIRPLLAANCFSCHGSDADHREADLRLDTFDGATAALGEAAALVPGAPDKSEMIVRMSSADPDLRMPPPDTGKSLTGEEIELVRGWIAAGGEYTQHWSFRPPERPKVPQSDNDFVRNPIDAFILKRLTREKLVPSPSASPAALLRRLSLDLTGLPPSIEELDAWLAEESEDAWSKQIDRLLSSPHFGEKWGRHWLDAARYADSDGFEKDKPRFVWFYRDWVVDAMNADMPYDDFIVQQLAGDLLPDRTQDQLVATGFLRNSMINEEGGVDPEQFRMEAMFDRMDAIGKSMLGITVQCTQCHNHKYDPITQRDYYEMFAFLNNCDESQATVYTREQMARRTDVLKELDRVYEELRFINPDWPSRMAAWEDVVREAEQHWEIVRPQLDASGGQKHYLLDDGSVLAQGYAPTKHTTRFTVDTDQTQITGFRLELLNDPNLPHNGPGRSITGTCAVSEFRVTVQTREATPKNIPVKWASASSDVNPERRGLETTYDDKSDKQRVTGPVEYAIDGDNLTAWGIDIGGGRSNVYRNAVFIPDDVLTSASGFKVTFHLVQMHGGWNSDDNQNNNPGRFRFSVTSDPQPTADLVPPEVRRLIASESESRSPADTDRVFRQWIRSSGDFTDAGKRIDRIWARHPQGHSQLVLHERSERRPTYILTRGDFLKPAELVEPGVPQLFGSMPRSVGRDRLSFARWITDRSAPTTARAIVNRIWQEYFGTGIVATSEDLGTQGEYPTHPELLDWLAVELMDNGWSLKHIHRLITESSTYRQSSNVSPELLRRDPENRLLARGSRFRVSGESVRDIFLAASGLLNRRLGGPSVYPPAPEFLFKPPVSYGPKTWATSIGDDRYRRALYTFRFRSVPYPVLQNFDTPRGDISCVRRARSNTPIQALTSLNEELFMECARALAQVTVSGAETDVERMEMAFRRCTARRPEGTELKVLIRFLESQRTRFENDKEAAQLLATGNSESAPELPQSITPVDLAAWTAVCRVILNLDEVITRG